MSSGKTPRNLTSGAEKSEFRIKTRRRTGFQVFEKYFAWCTRRDLRRNKSEPSVDLESVCTSRERHYWERLEHP